jgi:hypothetical protein
MNLLSGSFLPYLFPEGGHSGERAGRFGGA